MRFVPDARLYKRGTEMRKKWRCGENTKTNGNFLKIENPDAWSHKLGTVDPISIHDLDFGNMVHADRIERGKSAIGQLKTTSITSRCERSSMQFSEHAWTRPTFSVARSFIVIVRARVYVYFGWNCRQR